MTTKPNRYIILTLGRKQILAGVALLVVMLWSFSAVLNFVDGTSFSGSVLAEDENGDPVLIIDSATKSDPSPEKVSGMPVVSGQEYIPVSGSTSSGTYLVQPRPGRLFLQVAAVNRQLAYVYADYLTGRGIPTAVTSATEGEKLWVWVGPIQDATHLTQLQEALTEAGFDTL